MLYHLQQGKIVYTDSGGSCVVEMLPVAEQHAGRASVQHTTIIREIDAAIVASGFTGPHLLVPDGFCYLLPGFVEALTLFFEGKAVVIPELSCLLHNSHAISTYFLLEIKENYCSMYEVSVSSDGPFVSAKIKLPEEEISASISSAFAPFFRPGISQAQFIACVFDPLSVFKVRDFAVKFMGPNSYADWTLADTPLNSVLDMDFAAFFDTLRTALTAIATHYVPKGVPQVIFSPLTDYNVFNAMDFSTEAILGLRDIIGTGEIKPGRELQRTGRVLAELKLACGLLPVSLPFAAWTIVEAKNLSVGYTLSVKGRDMTFKADLRHLRVHLPAFMLGQTEVIRFYTRIETDVYRNIRFNIQAVEGKRFYHVIGDNI